MSVSTSAATRLPLSGRTGAQAWSVNPGSAAACSRQLRRRSERTLLAAAEDSKPEEASSSLKRPHSTGGGSARKRGQSVAFKEGHKKVEPQRLAKRELEDVDEAAGALELPSGQGLEDRFQ